MNIKEKRIKAGLSQQQLADKTGIPKDRIGKWEQGKGNPKTEDQKVLDNFFATYVKEEVPHGTTANGFIEQRRNHKLNQGHIEKSSMEGVPIYDVPIDASFLERYREEEFHPLYYLNIPKLRNCNFGAIISGSSMYPILKSGSIAMCRIVEDINYIDPGEMYLISTTNGFETVKYVQPGEKKDELRLIPHNEKILPTTIKKSMIVRICIVEAWLSFR